MINPKISDVSNGTEIADVTPNLSPMTVRFLMISLRHLLKNRGYAAINILSLSIGLSCFSIIGLWVKGQYAYDKMHTKRDRIYQINTMVTDESGSFLEAITQAPLGPALAADLSEVEHTVRHDVSDAVVMGEKQQFNEQHIIATDPAFLDVFDFKLLKGNPKTALSEPYTVIISQRIAKKYFGDEDPINKSLKIFQYDPNGRGADYKITGVIEDCPAGSHFNYSMLISFKTIEIAEPESVTKSGWEDFEYYTYVLCRPGTSALSLNEKLRALQQKYMGTGRQNVTYAYFLTPLGQIHFATNVKHPIQAGVSISYIITFSAIGLIVLIMGCMNYICMATAYSKDQLIAVGVHKVLGASNRQLVYRHLTESWLLGVISMVVSIVLIELSKPVFEIIFGVTLTGMYEPSSLMLLFFVASAVGILSGLYPALVLSIFVAVKILKKQFSAGSSGAAMRKLLVGVQYTVNIVLLIGILVTHKQLNYVRQKDLGFNKENLLLLATNGSPEVIPGYTGFANEVTSLPNVSGMARSNTGIGGGLDRSRAVVEYADGKKIPIHLYAIGVDHNYINTHKMSLVTGRNFIPGNVADSSGYIVNEAAAHSFGYTNPSDAIGKAVIMNGRQGHIIGVAADFHYATLREKIEPAVLYLLNGYFSRITVRMQGDIDRCQANITALWKKHFPETVVDFSFVDDRLRGSYRSEDRFSHVFFIFSIISFILAALGLFALVSYDVERRSKEIGIRKVLGGTVGEIAALLSKEYLVLVLIACLIAIPMGGYIMDNWLQNFAYRTSPGVETFALAVITNMLVALSTVGLKTVRSALCNPADSLRSE